MKLMDEVAKALSVIFEKLWQSSEAPADWKRGIINFLKRRKRKTQGSTGWSVSTLFLARAWRRSSWKLLSSKVRIKLLNTSVALRSRQYLFTALDVQGIAPPKVRANSYRFLAYKH